MKKLMGLFASTLFAASIFVAPASAITGDKTLPQTIYAACDQIYSDDPTAILECNGRR